MGHSLIDFLSIKENKMIDRRLKMIDKNKYVWECISCGRKQISETKPSSCVCGQSNYVINEQFVVTK